MQRIVFYLTSFEGGGAERNTVLIASELSRRGHPVMVIVDRMTGPNQELLPPSVEVTALPAGYAKRIKALRETLNAWNADVVFARLGLCPIFASLAKRAGGKWRVIISYHNPYDPKTSLGVRLSWWGVGLLSRMTFATFGVSHDISNQLRKYGARKDRCHVIHNPINLDWVNANKNADHAPALPSERPYIVSVGRLVPQKGYPDLIKAYSLIADQIKEDLIILGEGPLEQSLKSQITDAGLADRIHLLGYTTNPFPFYAKAQAFVLASHWEGFGNVIVEALACGAPVISTNCPGGPKDILTAGSGTLVPVENPEEMAKAIQTVLAAPRDSETYIARANDFDLATIASRYAQLALNNTTETDR